MGKYYIKYITVGVRYRCLHSKLINQSLVLSWLTAKVIVPNYLANGLSIVQTTPIGSISSIESVSTNNLLSTTKSYSPRRRRERHDVSSLLSIVQAGYFLGRESSFESCPRLSG